MSEIHVVRPKGESVGVDRAACVRQTRTHFFSFALFCNPTVGPWRILDLRTVGNVLAEKVCHLLRDFYQHFSFLSRGFFFPFRGIFIPTLNNQLNSRKYCRLLAFQSPNEFVIQALARPSYRRQMADAERAQTSHTDGEHWRHSVCQREIRWRLHRSATNWNAKYTIARTTRCNCVSVRGSYNSCRC